MRILIVAVKHVIVSKVTCPLINYADYHITKMHLYMSTAGGITMLDFREGHHMYGTLVLVLALIDMDGD